MKRSQPFKHYREEAQEGMAQETQRTYIAVDLKSYFASAECAARHLDPLTTNLVVADLTRTEKTICLAVSPSLKSLGVPGRPRLFEVVQKVKEINAARLKAYRQKFRNYSLSFTSSSHDAKALEADPSLELSYIVAPPRMNYYMKVSSDIYGIYLKYVAPEDILVYSIDEVFIDATPYLATYSMTPRELAMTMIREVLYTTGITATAGIGTNLYLAKVAMDIVAKHVKADKDGVRIAELDETSYKKILWSHKPLTDFWRIGPGIAKKLEMNGMYTVGDIARMSVTDHLVQAIVSKPRKGESNIQTVENGEELLYRLFGVNAELLIDHAWGYEPCQIKDAKSYTPLSKSMGCGQVLKEPYTFEKARVVLKEMADSVALDLVRKGMVCAQIVVSVGYDTSSLVKDASSQSYIVKYKTTGRIYTGTAGTDHYGRPVPKHAHGSFNFIASQGKRPKHTSSSGQIIDAAMRIFDEKVDKDLLIRRLNIAATEVIPEHEMKDAEPEFVQMDLFTDYGAIEREKEAEKEKFDREHRLQQAVLSIKDRYGKNAVLRGISFTEGATARERNMQVGGHRGGEAGNGTTAADKTADETTVDTNIDTEEGWTP